jgi:hypothetical protein
MYDVFYKTIPTGLFAHERPADNLDHAAAQCRTKFFWYLDGVNDYSDFDWHWQPAPWEQEFTHIFGTQWQRDGGAVFRAKTVKEPIDHFQTAFTARRKLSNNVIDIGVGTGNYFADVERATSSAESSHVWIKHDMIDCDQFDFSWHPDHYQDNLMHIFGSRDDVPGSLLYLPVKDFCAYTEQCRQHPTDSAPQLVDFARIRRHTSAKLQEKPLDIIYISNGEPDAEQWYRHAVNIAHRPIHRVMNVPGRAEAYKAAARMSTTDWFFTVFAKLSVSANFPWDWQPDRTEREQHYIFHAKNPVNGLEYGHMALLAYNKRLVLETNDWGLDFTLSRPHCVVPIFSGTAYFNADPFMTWRTAFREVLKLVHTDRTAPTIPNLYRLQTWLNTAQGPNAEYCLAGAKDAVAYYDEVGGDLPKLLLSFEWPWLRARFEETCKF